MILLDMPRKTPAERFWPRVHKTDSCWLWTGTKLPVGYGHFNVDGKRVYVHRWVYEDQVAPIPEGHHVDHLCMNKSCVNPAHLEAVSPQENTRRYHATITHCPQGHEYTEDNILWHMVKGYLSRQCRECNRIRCLERARKNGVVPWKEKPNCRNGHVFTPETTYINYQGVRQCRVCLKAAQQRYYQRKKDGLV